MKRLTHLALIAALLFGWLAPIPVVYAANLTNVNDTLTTLTQNVVANHTILFVTPTGIQASTDTITIDFTDFTTTGVAFDDFDIAEDNDGTCDGPFTDKTLAGTAAAGTWGVGLASDVFTLTPPTDAASGEIDAGFCVQVEIGTNATNQTTGNTQLTNPNDTSTHVVEIDGVFGDDGRYALDFVADDSVDVTGTVDASITFAISDTSIGFGTLSASAATWATADQLGSATDVAAHTISVGTNATAGYAVTYNGATLTSGGDTISVASVSNDANGTPGSEEFGFSLSTSGDASIATGYSHTDPDWTLVASTTTTVVSETGPTATETVSAYYLANIAANTEAGSYSTSITYLATATF